MNDIDAQGFTRFLKKSGKKPHVIDGLIRQVDKFASFLASRDKAMNFADQQDILDYVTHLEAQEAGSARVIVRGVALYF